MEEAYAHGNDKWKELRKQIEEEIVGEVWSGRTKKEEFTKAEGDSRFQAYEGMMRNQLENRVGADSQARS